MDHPSALYLSCASAIIILVSLLIMNSLVTNAHCQFVNTLTLHQVNYLLENRVSKFALNFIVCKGHLSLRLKTHSYSLVQKHLEVIQIIALFFLVGANLPFLSRRRFKGPYPFDEEQEQKERTTDDDGHDNWKLPGGELPSYR